MTAVLGDLVGRERRSGDSALRVDALNRTFSYRDFCTTAWKASHALRHLGVHEGTRVALAPDPAPQILQTFFGVALLGARATFDVTAEVRVVMGPVADEQELAGDRSVVVYGGSPAAAATTHWESVVWSENPVAPPGGPSPDDPALDVADRSSTTAFSHRDLLTRAERVVSEAGLDAETSVALRAPLSDPRTVVAAVVAPLLAGGTVVVPDETASADVAVSDDSVPEPRRIGLDAV